METPSIDSGRLRLRGWRREDFGPFAALRGSPEDQASRAVAERLGAVVEGQGKLNGEPRLIYRPVGPEKAKA